MTSISSRRRWGSEEKNVCGEPEPRLRFSSGSAVALVMVVEELDTLGPGGSRDRILEFLAAHAADRSVMLVGHEPDLGELAGALLFAPPASLSIKKAGACAIAFDAEVRVGAGSLRWFLPAKMLARLASSKVRV